MTVTNMDEVDSGADSFMVFANLNQAAMDALPQAVYLCAGDGRVVRFNQKAVELWGRVPRQGAPEERFCGSFRLYRTDGSLLPHDQCPMATALQTGESFRDQEVVVEQPNGQQLTVLANIAAFRDKKGRVNGAINCFQDITERRVAENRQRHLIQELNHRIKNTFAIVQSMAASTARGAQSVEEFASRFEARLLALSKAHELFSDGEGADAKFSDLLAQQLQAFASGDELRIRFEGPEVDLQPPLALPLSMVFHELMTNAAKYGALSVADGQISIEWTLWQGTDGVRTLNFQWMEMDGPPVEAPHRTGFGTRLIERLITGGLRGQIDFLFEPSGLQLRASVPLHD